MTPFRVRPRPAALAFRDFRPAALERAALFPLPRRLKVESLERAVSAANEWIAESGAAVLNVETILLPNADSSDDVATAGEGSVWFQIVRVCDLPE